MSSEVKHILKDSNFRVNGSLWIEGEEKRFLGPGRVELLERIADTGSINQAAKQMGMSYKKAWDMVNSINQHTIKPIVATQTGGEKGGGTIVTEEGKQLIAAFKKLHDEFQRSFDEKLRDFLAS